MSKNLVPVVAAVFYRFSERGESQVALFRRALPISGAGAWEFPGGKVDDGESESEALRREIQEELNLQIKVEEKIGVSVHDDGSKYIQLSAYFVQYDTSSDFRLIDHDAQKWVSQGEIKLEELAPADRPLVQLIFRDLRQKA